MVNLLLKHLHEKRAHCGFKSLIYESRKRFWIVGVRNMAKQVTSKCVTCKKLRRKPMGQLMGQLPQLWVAAGFPAFSNTAIDMFGPFQVKIGRKTLKEAHVIIFTCMTTRAIHLELVTDRSTDTFLMAFRRFASLRGHPINCWSDCGTNFVGAQQYLREECKIGISPEFWVSSQINFHAHSSGNGTYHELAIKMEWSKVSLNPWGKR